MADLSTSTLAQGRTSTIHRIQVQAFLDAAEEVDADEETLNDLLEGLDIDEPSGELELRLDAEEAFEPEEDDGFDDPGYNLLLEECESIHYLRDMPGELIGLVAVSQPCVVAPGGARHETSPQGERLITFHPISLHSTNLWDVGMSSFTQEYVKARMIPIPKLLYAFDVVLVSHHRTSHRES
jgi:hypothetical protein